MEEKTNYLAHHGVKGMRWGVRRYQNTDGSLIGAKKRKKAARKQYSKDFNRAYNFSSRHPVTQYIKKSKNYSESNRRWDKAYDSAEKYNKAKANYKTAKKEAKDNRKPLLSDNQKKGLKIGAAAVGTALAAYGAYRLNSKFTNLAITRQLGTRATMTKAEKKLAKKGYIGTVKRTISEYRQSGKSVVDRMTTKESKRSARRLTRNAIKDYLKDEAQQLRLAPTMPRKTRSLPRY